MTESTTSQLENPSSLSLGQQLKQAREALNLTIEDVAAKTNLKKSHLESLENDIFILQNVAPAFVRGYVRNYLRFLRLPESLIGSVNYGEVTIPKEISRNINTNINTKSQGKWVKYLTVLVLLCAIGMTLLWWWQEHQKDQDNREQFVSNTVQTESVPVSNSPQPATQAMAQPVPQTMPQPASNEIASVQPITAAQLEVATPAEQPAVPVQPATETTQSEAVNVLQQPQTTETPAAEQPVAVENNAELRIEVSGDSWITVRGAKNKRLAEKLYTAGEVLTFNDNEKYRLTIGAPANVKVYYKGQSVPLKPTNSSVDRISLPLAQ